MKPYHRFKMLKQSLSMASLVSASLLISLPAWSQSEPKPNLAGDASTPTQSSMPESSDASSPVNTASEAPKATDAMPAKPTAPGVGVPGPASGGLKPPEMKLPSDGASSQQAEGEPSQTSQEMESSDTTSPTGGIPDQSTEMETTEEEVGASEGLKPIEEKVPSQDASDEPTQVDSESPSSAIPLKPNVSLDDNASAQLVAMPPQDDSMGSSEQEAEDSTPSAASEDSSAQSEVQVSGEAGEVGTEELQQFANVMTQFGDIDQTAQQKITQIIDQSGLSPERFDQLYRAQQSPDAKPDMTPEEKASFEQAVSQLQAIQQETRSQQEKVLEAEALEPQRFQQILAAVQQDTALQQQLQQLLKQ